MSTLPSLPQTPAAKPEKSCLGLAHTSISRWCQAVRLSCRATVAGCSDLLLHRNFESEQTREARNEKPPPPHVNAASSGIAFPSNG